MRIYTLLCHSRLGSLSVASYDSQGYGGGILTRFHTGNDHSSGGQYFIKRKPRRDNTAPNSSYIEYVHCRGNVPADALPSYKAKEWRTDAGNKAIS
jgi:hypothetical protein